MATKFLNNTRLRIRQKIKGTAEKPRLSVFRSNNHIYAQLIDDVEGKTIVSSSTLDAQVTARITSGATCEASIIVGQSVAKKALERNITTAVFDRGGHLYHGRIKALSEAARKEGLKF
uniref:Large ribosomal subunit protein uL18c n=1 Tax=Cryptomonas sp. SAG 977-2f TaxID=279061 RepID=A0A679CC07_9CRYP|nr:ribosomal protein L18 [Cryptomonas sp. SAG 977-2f]